MEQTGRGIFLRSPRNDLIPSVPAGAEPPRTLHFNQGEEFFLRLSREFEVPSFPIHHDVRIKEAGPAYLDKLSQVLVQLVELCPPLLEGLSYSFDPTDILSPQFFCLYKVEDQHYLYLLTLDLSPRPGSMRVVDPGTNDTTPRYRTSTLYMESELIPLEALGRQEQGILATPRQTVSETWLGESGRGYFVQGIWLDRDLTRFFSRLFMPTQKRLYPYYPFNCRFRSVCAPVLLPGQSGRKFFLSLLHGARTFIETHIPRIEEALHQSDFSDDLETFQSLRSMVGSNHITAAMEKVEVKMYLNIEDMKEYEIRFLT